MRTEEFEKYVEEAIKKIPDKFKDLLDNITVEVDPDSLTFSNTHNMILGLYHGVPLPHRGPAYQGVMPDKITIYQKAFENYPAERLPELIESVVLHEIGHYFGMSDAEMEKYKKV